MELFRRWGVADRVRDAAALPVTWSDRVTFCTSVTGREVTAFTGVFGLDLAGSDLVAEPGQQVAQPVIEEVLREAIVASATASLLLGARVVALEPHAECAVVTVETDEGAQHTIRADRIIGADGPRSVVRRAMGAQYVGSEAGRPNVNITFRAPGLAARIPHPPSVHYWVLNPDSPGVVGPLDLDGTWWAISTGTASIADDAEAAGIVARLIGDATVPVEILATDPWQARMLLADRYRNGPLFLIGDAAHQNPPWGGHGFNTGVGDAANLGWKLAAVVQGWAPDQLLDSYEAERRPVAQRTIEIAAANTATLSVDLTDPALMADSPDFEPARRRAAATIQRTKDAEFHSIGLVLGTGYGNASSAEGADLDRFEPRAEPGFRLPHRWLEDGRSLYDVLGPAFTVIGSAGRAAPLVAAARRRGLPLAVVDLPEEHLTDFLRADVALVRPDQHLAWTGTAAAALLADEILDAAVRGFASAAR